MLVIFVACGILTIILVNIINIKSAPPIFGLYRRPGKFYCIKLLALYLLLQVRKLQNLFHYYRADFDTPATGPAGYGIKSRATPEEMDCRQKLSYHPKAIDAVYFNLANKEGWNIVVGTARRPHGVVNGFFYLNVPGVGLLMSPKLPDTLLFQDEAQVDDDTGYHVEEISITPFMAMRSWRIQYSGKMRLDLPKSVEVDVELNGVWASSVPIFDFDTDMDPLTLAQSMAREPWSKQYFKNIKEMHQTHYEQHGDFTGQVTIGGQTQTTSNISLSGFRDHSYGKYREWKTFHRYALHFITLADGSRMSVGVVCMPLAFSRLVMGYRYSPDGVVEPVTSCNLELYQHGEDGNPPLDYAFSFQAGSETYDVQVDVQHSPEFFMGWEWEARIIERLAKFKVNGVEGWGAAEWEYRHMGNRPVTVATNDPEWTKHIIKG